MVFFFFFRKLLLYFSVAQLVKQVFINGPHTITNDMNASNFSHKFMDITHFFLLNFGWIQYCSRHVCQPIIRNVSNTFKFVAVSFLIYRDNAFVVLQNRIVIVTQLQDHLDGINTVVNETVWKSISFTKWTVVFVLGSLGIIDNVSVTYFEVLQNFWLSWQWFVQSKHLLVNIWHITALVYSKFIGQSCRTVFQHCLTNFTSN